jgi:hypothetical protein
MVQENFLFYVNGEDDGDPARSLADDLREVRGVVSVDRRRDDPSAMNLGSTVQVIVESLQAGSALLALAKGVADWLRSRRNTTISIEKSPKSGAVKAHVQNIDPATALRITEIIKGS